MSKTQNLVFDGVKTVLSWLPERWLPGGSPDPLIARRVEIGRQAARRDGPQKVRGEAGFAAEVALPGLCHAALLHAPVTRARIRSIATAEAEAAPGVIRILTWETMPRLGVLPLLGVTRPGAAGNSALPVLQEPEVRYNGQVVALVLAESREEAEAARALIRVDYALLPAKQRIAEALPLARTPAAVMAERNEVSQGDAEAALCSAAYRSDQVYHTPAQNHHAIEPHAVTARWQGAHLTLWDATQAIAPTAAALAKLFGLPRKNVRVLSPFVGGGFGGKALWDHQILAAAAARILERPVRLALPRDSVARMIGGRSPTGQRVAIGADAEGRFTALIHTGYSVMPPSSACPEQFTLGSRAVYSAGSFLFGQKHLDLDVVPPTFMRAPGEAVGNFALESAVDELACLMALDPVALRLRNEPQKHPLTGAAFSQRAAAEAWETGCQAFGWSERPAQPGTRAEGEWLIGMGCAGGAFPYLRMPGGKVRLTLSAGGRAVVACSAQDMGMGTSTVQSQILADQLGLPLSAVEFEGGDSDLPAAPMAGGSAQTVSLAAALSAAVAKLVPALLRLAGNDSPLAGLRADEVRLAAGGVQALADAARFESFTSILSRAGRAEISLEASAAPPLEMLRYAMHSHSANFCQLRVSKVSGEIRIDRLLGVFDVGTVLNPKTAASQLRGGMIMGIGLALHEETLFDERKGRIMNPGIGEYHIPSHLDVPEIDVLWTGIPDPRSPTGARGIGEIGITGVAAAIANAAFNATGKRIRSLPLSPDQFL